MTTTARRFAATVAAVLASILLPLTIAGTWVHGVVNDGGTYVSTVGPLVREPAVRRALVDTLDRQLTGSLTAGVPGGANSVIGREVSRAARGAIAAAVRSPQFAQGWKRLNRAAHRQVLGVLRGDRGSVDAQGRVRIRLDPLIRAVLGPINAALPAGLSVTTGLHLSFTLTDRSNLAQARAGYRVLNRVAPVLPIAWLVALVLALVAAPDRRRIVTVLGVGTLLGLLALRLLVALERRRLLDRVPSSSRGLAAALWDGSLNRPLHLITIAAIVTAVVLVARVVLGLVAPRRRAA